VAEPPEAAPIDIVLVAVDCPRVIVPVSFVAPRVIAAPAVDGFTTKVPVRVLSPAQVWAPVLTMPGLVASAQEKVIVPLDICAPLA
jgi:hypothetical protein